MKGKTGHKAVTLDSLAKQMERGLRGTNVLIEKLAGSVVQDFAAIDGRFDAVVKRFDAVDKRFDSVDERFDAVDERFEKLEFEMRNGFAEVKRILERIDTRLSALELAVFGATESDGGRLMPGSLVERVQKLEETVFKK
ncbi:hypothetical protein COU20_00215 [Candidatus Kaiserbacteria bacterium CG10_big_fil_rev_8_21_14_0_10_59_10]|uniref:t-SNARE coiled-coil homology domain-containing protein n=1 Tax=Candidatus Kaiserbacteria bacterium CG10_big_fil_rev_8_21_14_0_10_59_10 TaxID=1974612 RepID=A0A2H0U8V6_9BACT|nr:MAG: hypothetical protein COU20_00215 [Candidatus Kaiserbacteria bacterium CG10_big_fil_rev_8_21_14_0_10_59_10]